MKNDIAKQCLAYKKKEIQLKIDSLKTRWMRSQISKIEFGKKREIIDIQLNIYKAMSLAIGYDWKEI